MKNKIVINLHSFVDLITNSSSEIFIDVGSKSVETIKELVNSLFKLGGSDLVFDDLFNIYTEVMDYNEYEYIKKSDITDDHRTENYEGYSESRIVVESKCNSEHAEIAAKILSKLDNLFDIDSRYNG